MKKRIFLIVFVCLLGILPNTSSSAANLHRIGGGIHYWKSIEDIIVEGVEEDGLALLLSYQYMMLEFFRFEADLEFLGEGYAGADGVVLAPQAYVLLGRGLYAGAGIGVNYSDGQFANSPFLALRTGIDLELLPSVYFDLNLNYRSEKWDFKRIDDEIQLNTISIGATVRIEFSR